MEANKGMPAITVPETIDVPMADVRTLSNGIKLYKLDCTDQHVVRVSFVFRAGTSIQKAPFTASSTINLLSEGTAKRTAYQIAEALDFHGSYYDVSLDRDYAVVSFVALSRFFPQTMELARELLLEPSFPEDEVMIYREKRKQRLAVERSKVSVKVRELFSHALFGDNHPYGVSYPESAYDNLTRERVQEFFSQRYTAENCFVVCSGRIKDSESSIIESLAADIPTGGDTTPIFFPEIKSRHAAFMGHEGAVQSAIRMGVPLFTRSHPDYLTMQVASTVLGGYFGSRLVRNLREERGYTYGVFSTLVNLDRTGYLAIATEVAAAATEDAVKQVLAEAERMRTEPVPAEELDMVRNIMTGEIMRILDGPFGIADVTIENVYNGTGNDYIGRMIDKIRTVTPEEVMDVAQRHFDTGKFTTAIVGPLELAGIFE